MFVSRVNAAPNRFTKWKFELFDLLEHAEAVAALHDDLVVQGHLHTRSLQVGSFHCLQPQEERVPILTSLLRRLRCHGVVHGGTQHVCALTEETRAIASAVVDEFRERVELVAAFLAFFFLLRAAQPVKSLQVQGQVTLACRPFSMKRPLEAFAGV